MSGTEGNTALRRGLQQTLANIHFGKGTGLSRTRELEEILMTGARTAGINTGTQVPYPAAEAVLEAARKVESIGILDRAGYITREELLRDPLAARMNQLCELEGPEDDLWAMMTGRILESTRDRAANGPDALPGEAGEDLSVESLIMKRMGPLVIAALLSLGLEETIARERSDG